MDAQLAHGRSQGPRVDLTPVLTPKFFLQKISGQTRQKSVLINRSTQKIRRLYVEQIVRVASWFLFGRLYA